MKYCISFVFLIISFASVAFVFNLVTRRDTWMGFYYINGDFYNDVKGPVVSSFDECMTWIRTQQRKYSYTEAEDFECGKNCKLSDSGIIYVCDETRDY